ncbi:MAG: hypothetical protein MK364_10940 [Pirellulales bacterium]|nr:hypothetical protein [Pirellulales bacterium]
MNRSLQLLRISVVLLITCLAGVQSAPCQVSALHGPIGRPSQSLSPGEASQLVEHTTSQSTPVAVEPVVSSSDQLATDAATVPPEPVVDQAVVLRSGHDPAYDRAVYDNSVAKPSPVGVAEERYLTDPRAVAMLSHGISRNVVVRRIALLSRLQEAAGRHRFAPQVAIKPGATKDVIVSPQPPMSAVASSVCPYVDQKDQARLALQVPPEPPLAAVAAVVDTETVEPSTSSPNVPLAGTEQLSQAGPETTSPVAEFPPEPGEPRLGYFIAVIDAVEEPGLGYFIAVIDGPEDRVGDENDDVTIASDPRPIGTGIGPGLTLEETPPEPGRDAIRSEPVTVALATEEAPTAAVEELQQDPQEGAGDALIEEVETPVVLNTETLENEEDGAIVAEPSVAIFGTFDGAGSAEFDGGAPLVVESIRTAQESAATLETNATGASPFPGGEPSPPAITPAIGRAFQQAWEKTFQRQ